MYGQEKKGSSGFVFDLEKEIKEQPSRGKEILEKVETRIHEMKKTLREGVKGKEFDQLEVLLQGYHALQKLLKKMK